MPPLYSILDSWLVVLTILKNISQWEGLSHILWKIKNVPNHQPVENMPLERGVPANAKLVYSPNN